MPANDGEHPVTSLFGVGLPGTTNAPGSDGVQASETNGPVVGTVGIRTPDSGARDIGHVAVHSGDTSGMADDQAAHASPIMPGPEEDYMSAGPKGNYVVSASEHGRYPWQQRAGDAKQ